MTADPYTIISADTHAGGSHADYRGYLEARFLEDFDAWRAKYRNPWKDLKDDRRARNWDSELRWEQQNADGVVAEVVFPNTVPPFFPGFVLFAPPPKPEQYDKRLAGIRAHNRWLADFCAEAPERRAGIGQIFTNSIDDAISDVHWIADNGLRGGVLLPNVAPDAHWVKPVHHRDYDPLWETLQELDMPVNIHGGTGVPNYGDHPASMILYINEVCYFSQRPIILMLLSGVFERFPKLRVVMTETGASWVPSLLERLDRTMSRINSTGQTGEIRYHPEALLPMLPSEYFKRNVWLGVSQPGPADADAISVVGVDHMMWGNDYPHDEGTYPFTREHLRQVFIDQSVETKRAILGGNAARFYDFDMDKLAPFGREFGPTVQELSEPLTELPDNPNEALLSAAGAL